MSYGPEHVATAMAGVGHTNVSTPGSANTKGSWTELIASTSVAAGAVLVTVSNGSWGSRCLFDLGIGGSGSEVVLIGNLVHSMQDNAQGTSTYLFPVPIPAGSRLSGRVAATRNDATPYRMAITLIPSGMAPSGGVVHTWGAATGDSGGTQLTAGTSSAKGSYVELVASTAAAVRWLSLGIAQPTANATTLGYISVDIATGASSSESIIIPDLAVSLHVRPGAVGIGPIPVAIPAGTRLSARIASTTNSQTLDLILYGIT